MEGVGLLDSAVHATILVGSKEHHDLVVVVREHEVSLGKKLDDEVVTALSGSKTEIDGAIETNLFNSIEAPRPDMLPQLESKL